MCGSDLRICVLEVGVVELVYNRVYKQRVLQLAIMPNLQFVTSLEGPRDPRRRRKVGPASARRRRPRRSRHKARKVGVE